MTQRPWSKLQRKTANIAALANIARVANNYMLCGFVRRIRRGRRRIRH